MAAAEQIPRSILNGLLILTRWPFPRVKVCSCLFLTLLIWLPLWTMWNDQTLASLYARVYYIRTTTCVRTWPFIYYSYGHALGLLKPWHKNLYLTVLPSVKGNSVLCSSYSNCMISVDWPEPYLQPYKKSSLNENNNPILRLCACPQNKKERAGG